MSYRHLVAKRILARSLKRSLHRPACDGGASHHGDHWRKLPLRSAGGWCKSRQPAHEEEPSSLQGCHPPTLLGSSRVRLQNHPEINPQPSSLRSYRNLIAYRSLSSSDTTRASGASPSPSPSPPTPHAVRQQTTLLDGKEVLQPQPEMASSIHSYDPHTTSITRLYEYLRLETFQNDELESAFDRVVAKGGSAEPLEATSSTATMNQENLQAFLYDRILESEEQPGDDGSSCADLSPSCVHARQQYAAREAQNLLLLLGPEPTLLSREDFVKAVRDHAGKVDLRRSLPISASMLLVGSSVGIISPALPFIVSDLGLSPTQFGMTVSAFALAKMLSNVPSAIAVERHGRKPYMIYSLAIVAVATAGIGFAGSFEELYVCRLLTGVGVAALSTSATMMMTDISTPLNRATTLAPIMSAFSAGTAVGPALGGYLVDSVGLHSTFYVVGLSFLGVAGLNRITMQETKRQPLRFPWQTAAQLPEASEQSIPSAVRQAVAQWTPLMENSGVRRVMIMNALYWAALAGSQMTLLPLILTAPDGLAMSATQVGQAYMGMSLIQIFGNPVFAQLADRFGKVTAIVAGCSLISGSMIGLTFCHDYSELALALGVWATGSSLLSTAPVAYVSDEVSESQRAQALALLRTLGDVGFLFGAMSSGALADWAGSLEVAMLASAGFLLSGTLWFGRREAIVRRLLEARSKMP